MFNEVFYGNMQTILFVLIVIGMWIWGKCMYRMWKDYRRLCRMRRLAKLGLFGYTIGCPLSYLLRPKKRLCQLPNRKRPCHLPNRKRPRSWDIPKPRRKKFCSNKRCNIDATSPYYNMGVLVGEILNQPKVTQTVPQQVSQKAQTDPQTAQEVPQTTEAPDTSQNPSITDMIKPFTDELIKNSFPIVMDMLKGTNLTDILGHNVSTPDNSDVPNDILKRVLSFINEKPEPKKEA